jgi:ribonuclease HI
MEVIMVQTVLDGQTVTVVATYWPVNYRPRKEEWEHILSHGKPPFLISGDFNCHHKELFNDIFTNTRGAFLAHLIERHDLVLHAEGRTFFRPHVTPSTLDISLVSNALHFPVDRWVSDNSFGSDHLPCGLLWEPAVRGANDRQAVVHRPDWRSFGNGVSRGWPIVEDPDSGTDRITQHICDAFKKSLTTMRVKQRCLPYWTVQCQRKVNATRKAYQRWRRRGGIELYYEYRRRRGEEQHFIKQRQRDSFMNFVQQINQRCSLGAAWRLVRGRGETTTLRPRVCDSLRLGGSAEPERDIEDHFREMFTARRPRPAGGRRRQVQRAPSSMGDVFTLAEFEWALQAAGNTSPGEDGLTGAMLRALPLETKKKLLTFINSCWIAGTTPAQWKRGVIVLIQKPGKDSSTLKGWRPICLTSVLGKLLERMVNRRLQWWGELSGMLPQDQHGFRWGRSTQDAIAEVTGNIREALQAGDSVATLQIDIDSAFTSVDLQWLSDDIKALQLPIIMERWLLGYITGRSVVIEVEPGRRLGPIQITRGLMQGSVLSPTLWTIHAAGLCDGINARMTGFADDFLIQRRHSDPVEATTALAQISSLLFESCHRRNLDVRIEKCTAVLFTQRRKKPLNLRIQQHQLQFQPSLQFLGVVLDCRLTGQACIANLRTRCFQRLNVLRSLSGRQTGMTSRMLLTLYRGFVRSILDYGALACWHASTTALEKLRVVETKGLRQVLGALPGTANCALYWETREMPLIFRWSLIRDKLAARRRTMGRDEITAAVPQGKQHAKRLVAASMDDRRRSDRLQFVSSKVEWVCGRPFWQLPGASAVQTVIGGAKRSVSSNTLKMSALSTLSSLPEGCLVVFTDGSKTGDDVGAAFVSLQGRVERQFKLPKHSSATAGELLALMKALQWAESEATNRQPVAIVSDSQAAIQLVANYPPRLTYGLLQEQAWRSIDRHSSRGREVILVWVPGHCGLEGNEAADEAAKRAAVSDLITTYCPPAPGEWTCQLKSLQQQEWRDSLALETKGAWCRGIGVDSKKRWGKTRNLDVMWNRLRLGTVRSAWWKFKVLKEGTGNCPICDQPRGDLEHILLWCDQCENARATLRDDLRIPAQTVLSASLLFSRGQRSASESLRAVESFFRNVGLHSWIRVGG